MLLVGSLAPAVPARAASQTFAAEADATVKASRPTKNFGAAATLVTGGGGQAESYVRFTVSGLSESVGQAVLRVFAVSGAAAGPEVFATASDWSEGAITYAVDRPARISPSLDETGAVTARSFVDLDVTTAVAGDGTYSFNIAPTSADEVKFRSREAKAANKRPLLIVTTRAGADTTPPDTVITSGPHGTWGSSSATFSFSSTEAGSTFACTLDGSVPASCTSPTTYAGMADGPHELAVAATDTAGLSDPTPATRSFTVVADGAEAVLVGAGDIATCAGGGDEATAALLDAIAGTVFTVGDNAYPDGSTEDFADCYDPTWGRHRARTRPVAGNHDYRTPGAEAYFAYFGPAAGDPAEGYYSYDLGSWHVVVLNSNCGVVACAPGSPQYEWLRADLAASPAGCTAAFWHKPRFSSGATHGQYLGVAPFWDVLHEFGAEVVVVGHEHLYERFAPQNSAGVADALHGIRQFTVGTGGKSHYSFTTTPVPNSEVRDRTSFGVLRLVLQAGSYDWEFVPVAGHAFTDAGTGTCH